MIDSKQIASPFKISSLVTRAGTTAATLYADNVTTTIQLGGGTANTSTLVRAAAAGTVNIGENTVAQTVNVGSTNGASATLVRSGTGGLQVTATGSTLALAATGANPITASTNGAERARITGGGVAQIGDGTINAGYIGGSLQIYSNTSTVVSSETYAATGGPGFTAKRGRGSPSSPTTVAADDVIGVFSAQGTVGPGIGLLSNFAMMAVYCDGTPSLGDSPGRWTVWTTPIGSSTLVERWRVTNAGHLLTGPADNTYDIGASGATRPKSIYVRTSFIAQGGTNQITVADGAVTQSAGTLVVTSVSGVVQVRAGGTNQLEFNTNSAVQWMVDGTSGDLLTTPLNNIGDLANTARPANVYVGTSVVVGTTVTIGTNSVVGSGALSVSATSANLTLSTITSGALLLTSAGAITASAAAASSVTITGANLTLSTVTTGDVVVNAVEGVDVHAGTNIAINSTGGTIGIGIDADAFAINIGTGTAARTITIGNTTGATGIVLNTGSGNISVSDATNFVLGTTTGTKFGTSTTQKLGWWNSSPVVQSAVAAFTNNVTSGGTNDQIDNYTDLTTYANDATTIRNNLYQLGRKMAEVVTALRLYGLLG